MTGLGDIVEVPPAKILGQQVAPSFGNQEHVGFSTSISCISCPEGGWLTIGLSEMLAACCA